MMHVSFMYKTQIYDACTNFVQDLLFHKVFTDVVLHISVHVPYLISIICKSSNLRAGSERLCLLQYMDNMSCHAYSNIDYSNNISLVSILHVLKYITTSCILITYCVPTTNAQYCHGLGEIFFVLLTVVGLLSSLYITSFESGNIDSQDYIGNVFKISCGTAGSKSLMKSSLEKF